jgi:hypothetical protein
MHQYSYWKQVSRVMATSVVSDVKKFVLSNQMSGGDSSHLHPGKRACYRADILGLISGVSNPEYKPHLVVMCNYRTCSLTSHH